MAGPYKIGDRVRFVDPAGGGEYKVGKIYTVTGFFMGYDCIGGNPIQLIEADNKTAVYHYRFEPVKEEQSVFKPKLINGRPMKELVWDGRQVLFLTKKGDVVLANAINSLSKIHFIEWAEAIQQPAKPDANGWWKFSEAKPELDELIQMAVVNSHYQSGYQLMTVIYTESTNRTENFTHWKAFHGPVV
jgi:hypothetical protein